jgi:tRNA(adenine34) deaminase
LSRENSASDTVFFQRAIRLALEAERAGNLPIGCVITLDGEFIAEGKNAIWVPHYNPNRHAEIEALRNVPRELLHRSRSMTLYTTLEPCLMCAGAILLHHVGRVLYGAADHFGGASVVFGHMSTYFEEELVQTDWIGPAYAQGCDPLFDRAMSLVGKMRVRGMA